MIAQDRRWNAMLAELDSPTGYQPSDNTPPAVDRRPGKRVVYEVHNFPSESPATPCRLPRQSCAATSPRRANAGQKTPVAARRASDAVHVRAYIVPSWFNPIGVGKKRKLIEAKGLPNFHNWRFVTLTCDREKFETPLAAYLAGSDKIRRFLHAGRKSGLWKSDAKWCWKFEFQQDGWPHWHLLIERRQKYSEEQLAEIGRIWGLGRTNTQRVNERGFSYNFKYAFKPVQVDKDLEPGEEYSPAEMFAPAWFLDHMGRKTVTVKNPDGSTERVEKAASFARVRFWQTSRGFYTGKPLPARPASEQTGWMIPRTVREVLDQQAATVQVVARKGSGKYLSSRVVPIAGDIRRFWNLVGFDTMHGGAVGLGVYSYMIPPHRLTTDPKTQWLLTPLLQQNRLTLRRALRLREMGNRLRRC